MSGAGSSLPPPLAAAAQGLTALRGGLEGGLAGLAAGLGGLRDGLARAASEVQRRQAAMQLQHLLQHPPPPPAARLPDPGFAVRLACSTYLYPPPLPLPFSRISPFLIVHTPAHSECHPCGLSTAPQSLSVSSWSRRAPQPVMADLAMHPGEVSARLRGLTVYTVVNNKNEFVLVSGEVSAAAMSWWWWW